MNKADKENREKQEKFQVILSGLLRDDDNKYCVDCDAKGPRWASWNLGVFLCIRCAGIHRNLGVHISKVKSVTLDAWSAEQVAMMQDMGNSKARAVYEANIPDNFRRPQTDSALEAFIRAKYEQKKYIAQEWVPPKPRSVVLPPDESSRDKKVRPRTTPNPNVAPQRVVGGGGINAGGVPPPVSAEAQLRAEGAQQTNKPTQPTKPALAASAEVDLLGLDAPVPTGTTSSASDDLFADFVSSSSNGISAQQQGGGGGASGVNSSHQAAAVAGGASAELSDAGLFNGEMKKTSAKDAIMALYGPSTPANGTYMMAPPSNGMIGMVPAGPGMQVVGGVPMQPMMMMGGGMMMMPPQQQQQYMGMGGGAAGGMMGGGMAQPQYNNMLQQQQQHMYNMHQVQNQMGSMNLGQGVGGMPLGSGAAPVGMPGGGQGFVQHPPMSSYPVPAMGNVWQ